MVDPKIRHDVNHTSGTLIPTSSLGAFFAKTLKLLHKRKQPLPKMSLTSLSKPATKQYTLLNRYFTYVCLAHRPMYITARLAHPSSRTTVQFRLVQRCPREIWSSNLLVLQSRIPQTLVVKHSGLPRMVNSFPKIQADQSVRMCRQ